MKMIILPLAITALVFGSLDLKSQDRMQAKSETVSPGVVNVAHQQDSVELAQARNLQDRNEERMADAKKERTESRAKAKESQRISNEADDAAKQSRQAVRAEKRAQKFRDKADKQARKAEEARKKSDGN